MSNRKRKPRFTIEKAKADEAGFVDAFELLVALHGEAGYAPLDGDMAAAAVFEGLKQGMTFLARASDGRAVGVLAMVEAPYWYSKTTHLVDLGFYVRPAYRRGGAGVALLQAAREEAQSRNRIALLTVTSPDRRPKATKATLQSQLAGFVPLGYTLKLR